MNKLRRRVKRDGLRVLERVGIDPSWWPEFEQAAIERQNDVIAFSTKSYGVCYVAPPDGEFMVCASERIRIDNEELAELVNRQLRWERHEVFGGLLWICRCPGANVAETLNMGRRLRDAMQGANPNGN